MNQGLRNLSAMKIGVVILALALFQQRPVRPPIATHSLPVGQASSSSQQRGLSWNCFGSGYRNWLERSQGKGQGLDQEMPMQRLGCSALQNSSSEFSNDDVDGIIEELKLDKDNPVDKPVYQVLVGKNLVPSFRELRVPESLDNPYIATNQKQAIEFYEEFLTFLQENQCPPDVEGEIHHVLPKHAGGTNNPENLIRISVEDHVALHFYRYQAFGERGDRMAYLMRLQDSNERAKQRAQLAVLVNKERKNGVFNPDWQRVQGLKGGKVGGKMNTLEQQRARSRVGTMFGRIVGLSNQSTSLKERLRHRLHWVYKDGTKLITNPATSVQEIIDQLNQWRPGSIRKPPPFYKVVHGSKKKMYGWTLEKTEIVDMAISSEAGEGQGSPERSETSA